jgi:hypothetical protein
MLCLENGVQCQYEPVSHARKSRDQRSERRPPVSSNKGAPSASPSGHDEPTPAVLNYSIEQSRRTSAEPGEVNFDNGLHVGPTSGISFLYRGQGEKAQASREGESPSVLSSYGDVPLPRVPRADYPVESEATALLYQTSREPCSNH